LFLVVLGAKLWVVQLYGSPLPLWDQWYEAERFFRPWTEGHLTWPAFFAPDNGHRIFFTRLLDLIVIRLNGRWEPLLQMTVNAFIHAAFACGLAVCLWNFSKRKNGWLVCFLLVPFFALPYAAENALWPMNSQQYFMSLAMLATLCGLGFGQPGGWQWNFGLAAAVMGLFTMASGLLAPVAVVGVAVLRAIKQRRMEKGNLITLCVCLAVIALGLALRATSDFDRSLRAHNLTEFAGALVRNLDWPFFRAPVMACLILLPLALLLFSYLRPAFTETRAAEFLLALGLWSALQSAALAYGRANYGEVIPASRYMDVLNVLVIASLFASVWLSQAWPRAGFAGWIGTLWPLIFAGVICFGVCRISQIVVDNLLMPTRMMNLAAEERVETFRADRNAKEFLEPPTVRPDASVALRVLQDPQLQTILPAACLPPDTPSAGHFTGAAQWLLRHAVIILYGGLGLFVGLMGCRMSRDPLGLARENIPAFVVLVTLLAALGFVWSKAPVTREGIERNLHCQLAAHFRSVNDSQRAAFHEHKADALKLPQDQPHAIR